jgi:predicted DNA-binding transcriptional regulator AlpA
MAKPTQAKQPATADLPATGYVRLPLLLQLIPFSRATVWRKVKEGKFPRPVKLSEHVTAWRAEDLRAWMERANQAGVSA